MATRLVLLFMVLFIKQQVVLGQEAIVKCLPATVTDDEFRFEFRLRDTEGVVSRIAFFDSSMTPMDNSTIIDTAGCVDDTTDSNSVFELNLSVDGDAAQLLCGIARDGDNYTITVAVDSVANSAFTFNCITGPDGNLNNFPTIFNITDFETGNIENTMSYIPNPYSLRLQAVYPDGIPVLKARLGAPIKLRAIYDQQFTNGPDTWGSVFHIPFLIHADADISLRIYTPKLETVVKVTGSLPGEEFTHYYAVERDSEVVIEGIPDVYRHSPVGDSWQISRRAIKVEVVDPGAVVAIKAISEKRTGSPQEAGSFVVLPDDVLGMTYNCPVPSNIGGNVLVYAVQDDTNVTINFNTFNFSNINISGIPTTDPTYVSLDENDVLNIECGANCDLITLASDKPIGIVTGFENETSSGIKSLTASQIPPVKSYGQFFVLIPGAQFYIITENPVAAVEYNKSSVRMSGSSMDLINSTDQYEIFETDTPTLVLMLERGRAPFTMSYPAIHQWAIRLYFYVNPGEEYRLHIVTMTGFLESINYIDRNGLTNITATTIGQQPDFMATPASSSEFEGYSFTLSATGSGLIELKSRSRSDPFMLILLPLSDNLNQTQSMALGTRFPSVNPCIPVNSPLTLFGAARDSIPGDMQDDDCDGIVDEDLNDGEDEDIDLAPHAPRDNVGIYVDTLLVSNNPDFLSTGSGATLSLITDGCSVFSAGVLSQVQPFSWASEITEYFNELHIVETPAFGAFYLGTIPTVYFQATVGFCYGDISESRCSYSCETPLRKRRQVDEFVRLETELTITDENLDFEGGVSLEQEDDEACSMDKLYWIPVALVLTSILIESSFIGIVLYSRAKDKIYF